MPTPNKELVDRFEEKFGWLKSYLDSPRSNFEGDSTVVMGDLLSFLSQEIHRAVEGREQQILSWHKLPIKLPEEGKIGPITCDGCGGTLYRVRGRHPGEEKRAVCPTCAIEILESIYSNLYPNNQAMSSQGEEETN